MSVSSRKCRCLAWGVIYIFINTPHWAGCLRSHGHSPFAALLHPHSVTQPAQLAGLPGSLTLLLSAHRSPAYQHPEQEPKFAPAPPLAAQQLTFLLASSAVAHAYRSWQPAPRRPAGLPPPTQRQPITAVARQARRHCWPPVG